MFSAGHKRLLVGVLLGVLTSSVAWAEPGDGLRAGNLKVTPGLTLSTLYDTNVFFESAKETESLSGAPSIRVEPFLQMETTGERMTQVTLDAKMGWQQYLSSKTTLSEQSGLSANLAGEVGINRHGAFSVTFKERFARTNEAPNSPTAFPFNRDINSLGLTLGLHPGDQVFQHYLTYNWVLYHHENAELSNLDRTIHHATLANNWRFLPRTALVLTADIQLIQYDTTVTSGSLSTTNSMPLRLTGGLSGSITNRIAVSLTGGWGWGFYEAGPTASNALVDGRVSWRFGSLSSANTLFLGYAQGFGDASISNYYTFYKPYAGYTQSFTDRMSFKLDGSLQLRSYPGSSFNDSLLQISAGTGFKITKWWSLDAGYTFASNFTDDTVQITTVGDEALRAYMRHLISLSTTIHY